MLSPKQPRPITTLFKIQKSTSQNVILWGFCKSCSSAHGPISSLKQLEYHHSNRGSLHSNGTSTVHAWQLLAVTSSQLAFPQFLSICVAISNEQLWSLWVPWQFFLNWSELLNLWHLGSISLCVDCSFPNYLILCKLEDHPEPNWWIQSAPVTDFHEKSLQFWFW